MADIAKNTPINGGTAVATEFKNLFSIIKTRRTVAFFMFAFVGFTVSLAFCPSSNYSSPWVTNIFSPSSTTSATTVSYRSQFPSPFNSFFSNTHPLLQKQKSINFTSSSSFSSNNHTRSNKENNRLPSSKNTTVLPPNTSTNNTQSSVLHANQTKASSLSVYGNPPSTSNQADKKENSDKAQVLKLNLTTNVTGKTPVVANRNRNPPAKSDSPTMKQWKEKKEGNGSGSGLSPKQGIESLIESLMNCDLFDGGWVKDNSYPLYKPGSCSFIDEQFSCIINGRPDKDYQKLKWKPKGCTLPRLDGGHMLELLRGKRLIINNKTKSIIESINIVINDIPSDNVVVKEHDEEEVEKRGVK